MRVCVWLWFGEKVWSDFVGLCLDPGHRASQPADQVWLDVPIVNEPPACAPLVFGTSAWPEGSLRVEALSSEDMSLSDLSLSAVGSGMKFRPSGRCHGNVSDLLREKNVPPWVRSRLPAVRLHGKLIWIAGLGWSNEASQYAGQLRLRWQADIYKVL